MAKPVAHNGLDAGSIPAAPTTVLVCGGREFNDCKLLMQTLDAIDREVGGIGIVAGDASGADSLAHAWAIVRGRPQIAYKANWEVHGRAAGPLRNQWMLEDGRPSLVVAFPGGRGTADMVRRARKACVQVREVSTA